MINIKPSINNQNITFENNSKNSTISTKGYLVHENPLQAAKSTVDTYVKTVKYAIDAVNGKGDDYSVGKINDLTTRLGSLGIATVLASMTKNPAAKTMEFAGFASFFAAMSIWPKVFIAAPLKAKTGFNVNQEYVDSYGRRKRFFEDPQYLAWDLYSSEELNKIGDKLKIPKNIDNREKHIKAKMQQIATQSNTLWMLTAGFATPLMASLMGNYISKYVNDVAEVSRAKSAIKTTGMADFTNKTQNTFQKIFVNPLADMIAALKNKKGSSSPDEVLKNLDSAYDAIFGKGDDASYEFNKGRLLYNGIPNDRMLTQYDNKLGAIVVKDSKGNIIEKIKTKNTDGISIFGNKWKNIPEKLADALGISPKAYIELMDKALVANKNGITAQDTEAIAEKLIKDFGGVENKDKLKTALQKMEKILTPSIKELEEAKVAFDKKLADVESQQKSLLKNTITDEAGKNLMQEKIKFITSIQKERLENKVVNTKTSWYSPVRILDIIAQHSDEASADVVKSQSLKEAVMQFIYGTTPHHINNDFNDIIKGDYSNNYRYTLGIDKFFAPLSEKTKNLFSNGNKFIENIDKNTDWLWNKLYDVANEKGKHFESICEWLGKTPIEFINDAAKQKGIYQGWLKKVGISFAVLTGITGIAISQFGKTNKYNPDVYRYKNEKTGSV